MIRNSKELPQNIKQKILDQIQSQLGFAEYEKMKNLIGEDGIIEMLLDQAQAAGTPKKESKPHANRSATRYVTWISAILAFMTGGIYPNAELFDAYYEKILPVTFAFLCVGGGLFWVFCWIMGRGSTLLNMFQESPAGWVFLTAFAIASLVAGIVNLFARGWETLWIMLIVFTYCMVLGQIILIPFIVRTIEIENSFLLVVLIIFGILLLIAFAWGGWVYLLPLLA